MSSKTVKVEAYNAGAKATVMARFMQASMPFRFDGKNKFEVEVSDAKERDFDFGSFADVPNVTMRNLSALKRK